MYHFGKLICFKLSSLLLLTYTKERIYSNHAFQLFFIRFVQAIFQQQEKLIYRQKSWYNIKVQHTRLMSGSFFFFTIILCFSQTYTLSFITVTYLLFFDTSFFFFLIFQLSVIKTSANLFKSAGEDGVVYNFDLRENEPVRKYVLVTV